MMRSGSLAVVRCSTISMPFSARSVAEDERSMPPEDPMRGAGPEPGHPRDLRGPLLYFLRLGLMGFGGPVALVGQMERELVAGKAWLTRDQMREAIAICQSLP